MSITRVLVRLPNWLGDLLMARPATELLSRELPGSELRAVAPRGLMALAGWDPWWSRVSEWARRPADREALDREVREWGPEAVLILPPSFSSAWWAWRTGARVRVGFRGEARSPLLTHACTRPPRGSMHLSQEYVRLVRRLADRGEGGGMETSPSNLVVPPAARARSEALLGSIGVTTSYAVLGPGAIFGPAKRWSPVRFAELGRILVRDGLAILVCGAAADREICLEVARGIGPGAHSLAGVTDLEVQAGVCAGARVVVTNDSGLGHLAAAVGASTVSLFGSTSSGWTAPLGAHVRVVQHAPVCAPCFQRTCRIGYRCLERIDTERVATACRELLAA